MFYINAEVYANLQGWCSYKILKILTAKVQHRDVAMASFFESESEEEEFIGFVQERESPRNTSDLESDITVSSVNTEDLSDFSVSNSESGEEGDEEWNSNPNPVVVNAFEANTGPVLSSTVIIDQ